MSKPDLVVLQEMVSKKMDIKASSTFVEAKEHKNGGVVSMGVDKKTFEDLTENDDHMCIVYVVNKKEFKEMRKE